jgi:thiol:disulfide interchange protein DsbC
MFATKRLTEVFAPSRLAVPAAMVLGLASVALAADTGSADDKVRQLLKVRLPKTAVSAIDCGKIAGLCEVTAGANLFYVDSTARYLVIGRVYDMETRQDITAARLLEMNPDMLVGGAAKANAAANAAGETGMAHEVGTRGAGMPKTALGSKVSLPVRAASLSLAALPRDGAIVWGNRRAAQTVTVFSDFRCSYCRALSSVLRSMDVKVVERPISVLGSRDLSNKVYCSKNREAALHAAYAGEPFESAGTCDTRGLDANEAFAHEHGLAGTPVIVRGDGAVLEGYRPKAFLEQWLRGGKS